MNRLIDAIEKTPAANIDPNQLGVTGCSRDDKGALVVGAYCDRLKLAIPQESGSGGDASWRVSGYEFGVLNEAVHTQDEITGENVWFRANFNQFNGDCNKPPTDHHELIGMDAPHAVLCIENTILWLGPESAYNDANAAHMIFDALGIPDHMGFTQVAHTSSHCTFQTSQQPAVTTYVQKFLVGGTADCNVFTTDQSYTFDKTRWVNWTVPSLQ